MGNHNVKKRNTGGGSKKEKLEDNDVHTNLHMKAQNKMGKMERKVRDTGIPFKW